MKERRLIRWASRGEFHDTVSGATIGCPPGSRHFRPLVRFVRRFNKGEFTVYSAKVQGDFVELVPARPRSGGEMLTRVHTDLLQAHTAAELSDIVARQMREQYRRGDRIRDAFVNSLDKKRPKRKPVPLSKFF